MYFIYVFLILFTVGKCSDSDDIVACTNIWTSVASCWDNALNADNDTFALNTNLNALAAQLTNDVYWNTPFTTLPVAGKSNVISNLKNVEAPAITNSTRITGAPRVVSQTLTKLQMSFLVTHLYRSNGDRVSQVERTTVTFKRVLLSWNIESLSVLVVQDSKDDLIQEIIALKMENQRLAAAYGAYVAEDDLSESHYQTIKTIYDHVVYPNPIPIVMSGTLPGVFSNNVHGRIHPVGTFKDFEGTIEYFYALSPIAGNTRIVAANLVHFISKENIAASEVIFTFADPTNGTVQANMTQKGFWRFDDDGLVVEFDLEILDLELRAIGLGQDSRNPAWRNEIINTVCYGQAQVCTGNNTQFATLDECFTFMNSIDFGTADRYWSNSVQCRQIHLLLAAIRPSYHCAHVGPTGGGKCVDMDYNSLYVPLFDSPPRLIN